MTPSRRPPSRRPVSVFDLLLDNVTRPDPDRPGYFVQDSGLRSTGVEIGLNGRITDYWLVFSGFADSDAAQRSHRPRRAAFAAISVHLVQPVQRVAARFGLRA